MRERLLAVAGDLFNREGVRAVGIDRILDEAGAAKASLYKHFPSKDDLIVAWLEQRNDEIMRRTIDEVERRARTPHERLLALFDVLEDWFNSKDFRGCNFINSTAELAAPHHPARRIALAHKRRVRDYLRHLVSDIAPEAADSLAAQLFLLIEGATVTALMEGDARSAKEARRAAEVLMAGA